MISERMKFLLLEAAKCFDDNYSPFTDEWLSKYQVTSSECGGLSELIGLILRGVVLSNDLTQAAILIQAVK